jgi:hypothetical protein
LRHFSGALRQGQWPDETKINGIKDLARLEESVRGKINVPKNKDLQRLLKDIAHKSKHPSGKRAGKPGFQLIATSAYCFTNGARSGAERRILAR